MRSTSSVNPGRSAARTAARAGHRKAYWRPRSRCCARASSRSIARGTSSPGIPSDIHPSKKETRMSAQGKVIITCAVTGAIHTPSMSPYLPVTPQEIADAAVGAYEAGAAIIHLHARDPVTGKPDQRPEAFVPFLKDIKARCDAVINLTTGGSPYMTVQERMLPAKVLKPEVASMNMGTMNFGLFPMLN